MIYVGWASGFSVAFAIPGYFGLAISAWLFGVLAHQQGERNSQTQLLDTSHLPLATNASSVSIPPLVVSTVTVGLLGAATTAFAQGNYIAFVVLSMLCVFACTHFYSRHLSTLWDSDQNVPRPL